MRQRPAWRPRRPRQPRRLPPVPPLRHKGHRHYGHRTMDRHHWDRHYGPPTTSRPAAPVRPASATTGSTLVCNHYTRPQVNPAASKSPAVNMAAPDGFGQLIQTLWVDAHPGGVAMSVDDVASVLPGSVFYAEQPSIGTFWAISRFVPSAQAQSGSGTTAGNALLGSVQHHRHIRQSARPDLALSRGRSRPPRAVKASPALSYLMGDVRPLNAKRAPRRGGVLRQDDQVVAVDDLLGDIGRQVRSAQARPLPQRFGTVAHQPLAKTEPSGPATSTASSGCEIAVHLANPGRQQRDPFFHQGALGPGVHYHRPGRRQRERDPELAGRQAPAARAHDGANARGPGRRVL